MKIAFCADLHLRGKDLEACLAQLLAMASECISRGVRLVAVAGDVFDRSCVHDQHADTGAASAVAMEWAAELVEAGIKILMIPGNHDKSGAGSADALHMFDGMRRDVSVLRTPGIYIFEQHDAANIHIACVPWSWTGENAERVIGDLLSTIPQPRWTPTILLAHVQVTGARMSGSFCCPDEPGKWQISRGFLESLTADHVALGDFHARQDLTGGRGGYVGALRQLGHGEEGNPAGFEIYDTSTGHAEWVELNAAPVYQTVDVAAGENLDPKFIASLSDPCGVNLRLRFDGATPDPVQVRQLEAAGVQIETILDRVERVQRAQVPDGIVEDRHAMIRLWAGAQNPPVENGRMERMIRLHDRMYADAPSVTVTPDPAGLAPETREALGKMAGAAAQAMTDQDGDF